MGSIYKITLPCSADYSNEYYILSRLGSPTAQDVADWINECIMEDRNKNISGRHYESLRSLTNVMYNWPRLSEFEDIKSVMYSNREWGDCTVYVERLRVKGV